jgi:hypothetical protein
MYAGESAVFLSGLFAGQQTNSSNNLPIVATEVLPVSLSGQVISLSKALDVSQSLRRMADQVKKGSVSSSLDEEQRNLVFASLKDFALCSLRDNDTVWSRSLVGSFFEASQILATLPEQYEFTVQMDGQLMARLEKDILKGEGMHFTPHRVEAVQKSLKTIGRSFTQDHAGQIYSWTYQQAMSRSGAQLTEALDQADTVMGKVDHILRFGG